MKSQRLLFQGFLAAILTCAASSVAAQAPTAIRSFSPTTGATFKTAAACYDSNDTYVIAAVFTMPNSPTPYDALYRIRVQGLSTAPNYGQAISTTFLKSEWTIDSVDCASNGSDVFVAWDARNSGASWYRLNGSAIAGPYAIRNCEGIFPHHPRISYGGGRVAIAYEGGHAGASARSCGVCSEQYTTSGALIVANEEFWNDGMTHEDFDIEYNGAQFILALQWQLDWSPDWSLTTRRFNSLGQPVQDYEIRYFPAGSSPAPGYQLDLVYSANWRNSSNRLFIQTDTATYWLTNAGAASAPELNHPLGSGFAACEYWGTDLATAAVFSTAMAYRYVGTFPSGYFTIDYSTRREHFASSSVYETFSINPTYGVVACEPATTYTNGETIVVSRTPTGGPNAFWNLVPSE
jgi:hypothetical protein